MKFAMMNENIGTLHFSAAIFGGEIRNIRFPQTPCSWSSPLRFPSVGRWSPGLAISMSREDKAGRNSVSTHPQNWNISLKSCRIFFTQDGAFVWDVFWQQPKYFLLPTRYPITEQLFHESSFAGKAVHDGGECPARGAEWWVGSVASRQSTYLGKH